MLTRSYDSIDSQRVMLLQSDEKDEEFSDLTILIEMYYLETDIFFSSGLWWRFQSIMAVYPASYFHQHRYHPRASCLPAGGWT